MKRGHKKMKLLKLSILIFLAVLTVALLPDQRPNLCVAVLGALSLDLIQKIG
jgi:uncharacterized membrane protein